MKTVLMVAEKPSLAQSLAKILSNGSATSRKGFNGACSIHEYNGQFHGQNVRFKFTSVCGHVMTLDFLPKFNNWDRVDPADLFAATTEKKEATAKLKMPAFLEKEAKGCDYLVLWLDCDKEGENICFEVIEAVKYSLSKPKPNEQQIYRARFSSITDTDVKRAMANLSVPNESEARSVDARLELDLRIGCAFTRFQTKFFQGKYGDLDSTLISFGPCQTPTLGFCVERHDKIQSFKPETYWVLNVELQLSGDRRLQLDWERVRIFDREVIQLFQSEIKKHDKASVIKIDKKQKSKARPVALNTVELLRTGSSGLGFGPQYTMQIAERLYTQGYISYPRTETTQYPANFDLKGTLRIQCSNNQWGSYAQDLLSNGINKPKQGQDAGDHPPITPMKPASEDVLERDAWKLYEFITKYFIATIDYDCKYLQTTIMFKIGQEIFSVTGNEIISPGFTSMMSWKSLSPDGSLPSLNKDDTLSIRDVRINERQTNPPDYLTESELISLMEKFGIGTDASIPVHINNICERNYVTIESGRRLKPTALGIVLVHGYQKIDKDLVKPTMRAGVEEQLTLIAQNKADFDEVLSWTLDVFEKKFRYFVENISGMDELFEVTFSPLASTGKPLSRCGKCKRFMKLITAKPSRLHCSTCNETFNVPQNGNIKLYKELKCPLDDFELVLWTTGGKGKAYPLCPYCLNHPPFPDMRKGMGCNECTHPTCPHALEQTGVSNCLECDNGTLVLDPTSAPKWRMCCNRCNVVINMFENAHKINLTDNSCEECQSTILKIEFNKNKTPLDNGNTSHIGCVFCDPILIPLMEIKRAMALRRKRAGQKSSRPRRKGPKKPKDKMAQLAAYFV